MRRSTGQEHGDELHISDELESLAKQRGGCIRLARNPPTHERLGRGSRILFPITHVRVHTGSWRRELVNESREARAEAKVRARFEVPVSVERSRAAHGPETVPRQTVGGSGSSAATRLLQQSLHLQTRRQSTSRIGSFVTKRT